MRSMIGRASPTSERIAASVSRTRRARPRAERLRSQAVGPGVHDLGLDLGAVFVSRLDQRPVRLDRFVGGQVQAAGRLGVLVVAPGGAQRDQADPAPGAGGEVVAGAL